MLTFPPDFSFVIQIASFLVLWFGLKRLLFDPVLHVLEEREARTSGAQHRAVELKAEAEVSAAEYERRLHESRVASFAEAEVARSASRDEERRILAEVREQASAQLAQLRDNLGRQAEAARPALASEARDLASLMAERVVGRGLA
jgi:F-type H+-transporting ATPase subunit b